MVTKVVIRDNTNSPIHYISDLENFKNGKVYEFKPGVNVIVGENGSGKTTLMNLIKKYLCVDYNECFRGDYNCNINALFRTFNMDAMLNGVDVYADYNKNTFRLSHAGEKAHEKAMKTFEDFGSFLDQNESSTGEGVLVAINYLFGLSDLRKLAPIGDLGYANGWYWNPSGEEGWFYGEMEKAIMEAFHAQGFKFDQGYSTGYRRTDHHYICTELGLSYSVDSGD